MKIYQPLNLILHCELNYSNFPLFNSIIKYKLQLLESLDIFGHAGFCIGIERCQLLQNSLIILQQENHFQKCYYWGRINGINNDYYIAYGYKKECLEGQTYFYSIDCLNWLLMPEPSKCAILLTSLTVSDFQGDPSVSVNAYDANPPYPPNENPQQFHDESVKKYLMEEDRLAATIYLINNDAAVVPRGSWLKTIDGQIIENSSFCGLESNETSQLKSYLHARLPQNTWNTNLLSRRDYDYALDFLDTLDEDVPSECWSLQFKQSGRLILLHSMYWPGMTFFHKVNTPHYGFLYIGNGKKNIDIPFML